MSSPEVLYQAGDHASRPASGAGCVLYSCTDHDLVYRDDGTSWTTFMTLVGGSGGDIATDTIWDAAGDLVQGSGANTGAKLPAGLAGQVLRSAGAAAANTWAYPPGYEFDYVQKTTDTSITATNEATANTIVTGAAKAYDGSTTIIIEAMVDAILPAVSSALLLFWLYDDTGGGAASVGAPAVWANPGVLGATIVASRHSALVTVRLTPTAATHTYSLRASVSSGTGTIKAGVGGNGVIWPTFMRQIKV